MVEMSLDGFERIKRMDSDSPEKDVDMNQKSKN